MVIFLDQTRRIITTSNVEYVQAIHDVDGLEEMDIAFSSSPWTTLRTPNNYYYYLYKY